MDEARAIRERLTAMLELSDENLLDQAVVATRESVAVTQSGDGAITSREIGTTGPSGKRCGGTMVLDVAGTSHTGDDGSLEVRLSDYFCAPPGFDFVSFVPPINFVATPQTRNPVYLTARQRIVPPVEGGGSDVLLSVWSWNSSGSPAPRVSFDWRCFAAITETVT
jgi:hypothetical protein